MVALLTFLAELFDSTDFVPRPACGGWTSALIWTHNISDALIWLSYMTIPFALVYMVKQRHDLPFKHIFWLFGVFIVTCGFTHLLDIFTFYVPFYRFAGAMKAITAFASVATVIALVPVLPQVLALRGPEALEKEVAARTAELAAANERLRFREAQVRAIVDTVIDGIITIDENGCIGDFNPAAEKIFGYAEQEVAGQNVMLLMPEPFHSEHDGYLENYKKTGDAKIIGIGREVIGRRKDGGTFPMDLAVSEMVSDGRRQFVGIVRDITDRKEAEDMLEAQHQDLLRSNAELEEFAYVSSHDLKAPLRGIQNLATWISQDADDVLPEESKKHLIQLKQRVTRLENLLDSLLVYSRVGRADGEVEDVDTHQLVQDVVDLLAIPDEFTVSIASDLPVIKTPSAPLRQVIQNLVDNAIKHHDKKTGKVEIWAEDADAFVRFCVTDDGVGIAETFHDRIFQVFHTLKPRDEVEGSGMGLAIVKKVITQNGGTIEVQSGEDRGTTFSFTWPKVAKR